MAILSQFAVANFIKKSTLLCCRPSAIFCAKYRAPLAARSVQGGKAMIISHRILSISKASTCRCHSGCPPEHGWMSQRAFDLLLSSSVLCLWNILASEPSDVKQEIHGPECLVILHNIFVKNTQIFCKFAMSFFPKQKKKRSVYLSWVASLHLQNQFHILCNEFCPAASLPKQWIGAHKKKKRRSKVSFAPTW